MSIKHKRSVEGSAECSRLRQAIAAAAKDSLAGDADKLIEQLRSKLAEFANQTTELDSEGL